MDGPHPRAELQAFIDDRWAVAQPRFYPHALEGPRVQQEVTAEEAEFFLAAVRAREGEAPLFVIDDERKLRSDRYPRRRDGTPRGYLFFEEPGPPRLETIVHIAAMARLRDEFGWPIDHMICESPDVLDERGSQILGYDALDILLLNGASPEPTARMTTTQTSSHVIVEAKATPTLLEKLIREMRSCAAVAHPEHNKCRGPEAFQPSLFLAVAAGNTWRLFRADQNGQAALGDELPDFNLLHFGNQAAAA